MKKVFRTRCGAVHFAMVLWLLSSLCQGQPASSPTPPANGKTAPATLASSPDTNVMTVPHASLTNNHVNSTDKRFMKKAAEGGQLETALAELALERTSSPEVRSYAQQLAADHKQLCEQLAQLAQSKGQQKEVVEYSIAIPPIDAEAGGTSPSSNTRSGDSKAPSASQSSKPGDAGKTAGPSGPTRSATTGAGATNARAPSGPASDDRDTPNTATSWTHPTHTLASAWNDPITDHLYARLADKNGPDFDRKFISMMVSDHEDDVALFEKEAEKAGDTDVRTFAQAALPKLREHLNQARQIETALKP